MNILFFIPDNTSPRGSGVATVVYTLSNYFYEQLDMEIHFAYVYEKDKIFWETHSALQLIKLPSRKVNSSVNKKVLQNYVVDNNISFCILNSLPDPAGIDLFYSLKNKCRNVKIINIMHSVPFYQMDKMEKEIISYKIKDLIKPKFLIRKLFGDVYLKLFKQLIISRYQKSYSYSDLIIMLSDSYKEELITACNFENRNKLLSVPNPISPDFTNCSDELIKKKQIIYVGRLHSEKGVDRLLKIWNRLYLLHPDWNLLIVGDGINRGYYESLAADLELKNYEFTGYKDPKLFIKASSILCLTSDYEGFPMVLGEAMTLGTIPFTFDNYGASSTIIDHAKNGFLIPAFDLDKYAENLNLLMSDPVLLEQMSENAKLKSTVFSIDVIGKTWHNLLLNSLN